MSTLHLSFSQLVATANRLMVLKQFPHAEAVYLQAAAVAVSLAAETHLVGQAWIAHERAAGRRSELEWA
jgi:hypothetical protein